MSASSAWLAAILRAGLFDPHSRARRAAGDAGEGVISVAIAVLIMAFLGAAVWGAFNIQFTNINKKVTDQVEEIGK